MSDFPLFLDEADYLNFNLGEFKLGNIIFPSTNINLFRGVNVITGPSGIGKSTMLTRIISLRGEPVIISNQIETLSLAFDQIKPFVSYLCQDNFLFGTSFIEFLNFFGVQGVNCDMYNTLLKIFEIDFLPLDPNQLLFRDNSLKLSGGQLRKFLLVANLCLNKKIVLLDEPTSSLDPESSKIFFDNIEMVTRNKYVVIVTHDVELLKDYDFNRINIG